MKANEAKMLAVLFEAKIPFPWNSEMDTMIKELLTLHKLAKKHRRLTEMGYNGNGVIRGQHYYNGTIDDYARKTYGHGVKTAYITDTDTTIFDLESDKVQDKIETICKRLGLLVKFQWDPRGYTVKVYRSDRFMDIQG